MNVKDTIVAIFGSVGVRNYLRLKLSPDANRVTDEWLVDPTSKQITINSNATVAPTDLLVQLLQARTASMDATYTGEISATGTPLDNVTVANFTVETGVLPFQTVVPTAGEKQKTFALESFNCVVGRLTHLSMVPSAGAILSVNPAVCAIVTDDRLAKDTRELLEFLLSRRRINATPYVDNGIVVKLELETDAE